MITLALLVMAGCTSEPMPGVKLVCECGEPIVEADAIYARTLIEADGGASVAEWRESGTLKDRYRRALEAWQ